MVEDKYSLRVILSKLGQDDQFHDSVFEKYCRYFTLPNTWKILDRQQGSWSADFGYWPSEIKFHIFLFILLCSIDIVENAPQNKNNTRALQTEHGRHGE